MYSLTLYTATHGYSTPVVFPSMSAAIAQVKMQLPGCWNTDGNEICWRDDIGQWGYVLTVASDGRTY